MIRKALGWVFVILVSVLIAALMIVPAVLGALWTIAAAGFEAGAYAGRRLHWSYSTMVDEMSALVKRL